MTEQTIIERAKNIKLVLTDVDGVLTDGKLYFDATGESLKVFHVHDGVGIKQLMQNDIPVGIITGRKSKALEQRASELGIKHFHQKIKDKLPVYKQILTDLSLTDDEVAYIGDDLPDLEILETVGFSVSVADAQPCIKSKTHYCTKAPGGKGAFREVSDFILRSQNKIIY